MARNNHQRAIRRELMTPQTVITILQSIPAKSSLHIKRSLLQEIIGQVKQEFHL